jgi:hypothetical protein
MIVLILSALLAAPAQAADPPPVYAQRTRSYDVSLRIDPALESFAGVYVGERDGTLRGFNAFEREADQMHALQGASGFAPWVERVDYTLAAETPHLIGVIRRAYVDRHGAHPDLAIQGFILDRASGRPLGASDLLEPGADMAPLDAALQHAVDAAKSARHDGHPPPTPPGSALLTWDTGRPAVNPRRSPPSDASLVPSSLPGKAAGLQFVFAPYDNGPYSDCAYRVVLPSKVFAGRLRPQYRDDFADAEPRPSDDPLAGFPADLPPAA